MRVTPEAYILFDTGAPSVPELCDAFKYRFVPLSCLVLCTKLLSDILIYKTQPASAGVARLLMQVRAPLGTLLLVIELLEGCRFGSLLGRRILTALRRARQHQVPLLLTVRLQRILERPTADMVRAMHRMEDYHKGLQALQP